MPSDLNLLAQRSGDYMEAFDNFRALMTDFSRVTGLSIDEMEDDALVFSSPDGSELSFFYSQESGYVAVMVTAGLLPEADRPAIAEILMRDNPALWIASGAAIGLTERGEACLLSGAPLEHLSGPLLASMTQGLVELATKLEESLKSGFMRSGAQARDESGQADLFAEIRG
jgi:Tir chaperone protein (CesT) family